MYSPIVISSRFYMRFLAQKQYFDTFSNRNRNIRNSDYYNVVILVTERLEISIVEAKNRISIISVTDGMKIDHIQCIAYITRETVKLISVRQY